ncbi:MAG TPA: MBL fold metallo-hydrolase [Chitinophagaceae bacterium]|nr:MBL fold metallo-hydrolase [Chitinophagaceae bacterium]
MQFPMSLFICSLNSGSNGNCYYVGNETEAILVDAGISCAEIEKRMKRLGLSMQKLKAVFISHEHTDHISGVRVLSKKYKLPVYITNTTHRFGGVRLEKNLVNSFTAHQAIDIGNLSITAFPKFHDAADPYSFIISCNKINVGVFTDIGTPCVNLVHHFKQCHAAFLEANYDDTMLENGRYPHFLKNRIRGNKGHLSNKQALELFTTHRPSFMSHLFLSHISKNNNCPKLVQQLFNEHANGVQMIVTSRYQETAVHHIHAPNHALPVHHHTALQLALAFA